MPTRRQHMSIRSVRQTTVVYRKASNLSRNIPNELMHFETLRFELELKKERCAWDLRIRGVIRILVLVVAILTLSYVAEAATFTCSSGDVACIVSAIHTANTNGQANTIILAAGTYRPTVVDNFTDGPTEFPSIASTLNINGAGW